MSETADPDFQGTKFIGQEEAAAILGVKPSRIKQLVRDGFLVGRRKGGEWLVPADAIVPLDSELGRHPKASQLAARLAAPASAQDDLEIELPAPTGVPLWSLHGTVLLLRDGGFDDDRVLAWLLTSDEQLGVSPLELLRGGFASRVRSLAQVAGW